MLISIVIYTSINTRSSTFSLSFSPPALIFSLPVANFVDNFSFPLANFSRMFGIVVAMFLLVGNVFEGYFWYWFFHGTQHLTSKFSAASASAKTSRCLKYELRTEYWW